MIEKQTRDNKIEISKLAKETIKLSADIEDVGETLGEVQTAVTTATSGIAALEAATTTLTEQTNTVKANVSALSQQTTALETQTSSLQIANVGINERLGVVESDLTTQNSTLETHATELAELKARITALENIDSGNTGGDSGNTGGDSGNTGGDSGNTGGDSGNTGGDSGNTGGDSGNTGGDDIDPNDNFGTKYYNVTDISELYNDYETESAFAATSTAKFVVCAIDATGPETSVYFRHNIKNKNTTPHIKLWFWISGLPSGLTTIPCNITLNGNAALSTELTLLENTEDGHNFFCEFDIDPALHTPKVFNDCHIKLASTALAESFWDWVKVEISNTTNPIILNRNLNYEIYCMGRSSGSYMPYSSKYIDNGQPMWIGGTEGVALEDDNIETQGFGEQSVSGDWLRWGLRMPLQLFSEGFRYSTTCYIDYYLTQTNTFFIRPCNVLFQSLINQNYYINNVLLAKRSLHNGIDKELSATCVVYTDFSVGLINTFFYNIRSDDFLTNITFNFNNQSYPKEFIDFIPVYDFTKTGQKTNKLSCGYILHHQSGNIIFVPDTQSSYFLKIGKGRQVHAYLSQDNLSISVYFQLNENVIKKILVRETENAEWTLENSTEIFENVEEVIPFATYYYVIKDNDIIKIDYE